MATDGDRRTVSDAEWAKFGLQQQQQQQQTAMGGDQFTDHQPTDSLFAEDQRRRVDDGPWWKTNFFVKEPILFGTWDGVFTSVMVNIFGVIVFLRMGWIVGNAGVANAVLMLLCCAALALAPVLSAIGICERCQIQSGGVYFLVSHILGGQIGGAVGVLYCFGQAVATSLVAVGFGDAMTHLITGGNDSWLLSRFFAISCLVVLVAINIAGVKWVVKLQLALLLLLFLAVGDMLLGSLFRYDPDIGVVGYNTINFNNNTGEDYVGDYNFYSVFGVFFSNFIGVLAGVNMSGDLREPSKNIPLGELAAVGVSSTCCFLFIMVLGSVCTREALQYTKMIEQEVSATRLLFLAGLYVSSLSSILGSLYGAPRVLQTLAGENIIPIIKPLDLGKGPNKIPVLATFLLTGVSLVFVVFKLNTLALIATIPFLITYAFVNYSYVSLAFTYDLQQQSDIIRAGSGVGGVSASYGSMGNLKGAATGEGAADLDQLFPERQKTPLQGAATVVDPESEKLAGGGSGASADGVGVDKKPTIIHQPTSWYSMFCNRWISLVGAVVNLVLVLFIHPLFAILHFAALIALYFYIGSASPGVFPGISEFSIPHSIQTILSRFGGPQFGKDDDQVIVAPLHPGVDTFTSRLNEDNADYSGRKQYHQTKTEPMQDFD